MRRLGTSEQLRVLVLLVFVLAIGCAHVSEHPGASLQNDGNVLTGGPVTGTTVRDLPPAVKNSLLHRAQTAEVADIVKQYRNGRIIYKITFVEPRRNPTCYIAEDGSEQALPRSN